MSNYQNKVVWITGASSGIGEALAMAFAKEGAKLVLSSRRANELNNVKQKLNINEKNVLVLPLDLADTNSLTNHAAKVIATFGKIDVLINNGGISQRSWVKDTPLDIDRKIMEVNFFGTVALTKAVLPHMIKQNSGQILVISSIAGKFGFYLRSAYSASKHALHGFFESLRMEVYNNNIKVMMACPGKIKTDISLNALNAKGEKTNLMDESTEKGISAAACAQGIIKGLNNNKYEIFIGGKEMKSVWIKRFFPTLFTNLLRKQKAE